MPKVQAVLLKKIIRIAQNQQDMLDTFIEKWGFVSESEVIRRAITEYYRKTEPLYLQQSPIMKEKVAKLAAKKKLEVMSDEEFARTQLKAYILTNLLDGEKFAVVHTLANMIRPIPLKTIKEWAASNPDIVKLHLNKIQTVRVVDELKVGFIQQQFEQSYGVKYDLEDLEIPENTNSLNATEAPVQESSVPGGADSQ